MAKGLGAKYITSAIIAVAAVFTTALFIYLFNWMYDNALSTNTLMLLLLPTVPIVTYLYSSSGALVDQFSSCGDVNVNGTFTANLLVLFAIGGFLVLYTFLEFLLPNLNLFRKVVENAMFEIIPTELSFGQKYSFIYGYWIFFLTWISSFYTMSINSINCPK